MPLFSVIVPFYNRAETLRKSIESVLYQSFEDWELLLLDDGSKDGSLAIAQSIIDTRVKVYSHQKNKGVSYTRNMGICEACGDYLVFLDSDDYIEKDYLLVFAKAILSCNASIAIYFTGLIKEDKDGRSHQLSFPFSGNVSKDILLRSFYEIQRKSGLFGFVASKAVRRLFVIEQGILFNLHLHQAEDMVFFMNCYKNSDSFYFINYTGYHYIRYTSGTAIYRSDTDFFSLIDVQREMKRFCSGYMTADDNDYYTCLVTNFAKAAVYNSQPEDIFSIPSRITKIRNDNELNALCHFSGPLWWIMLKVFARGVRIRMTQTLLKKCKR